MPAQDAYPWQVTAFGVETGSSVASQVWYLGAEGTVTPGSEAPKEDVLSTAALRARQSAAPAGGCPVVPHHPQSSLQRGNALAGVLCCGRAPETNQLQRGPARVGSQFQRLPPEAAQPCFFRSLVTRNFMAEAPGRGDREKKP